MAKATKKSSRTKIKSDESDSAYFLKIVLYVIIGSQWVRFIPSDPRNISQIPIPIGLIIGLGFAMHEHFQIDRKIEYALLLIVAVLAFWLPLGLEIRI